MVLEKRDGGVYHIVNEDSFNYEASFFHELLHWYHFLRDRIRFNKERYHDFSITKHPISDYYWGDVKRETTKESHSKKIVSLWAWSHINDREEPYAIAIDQIQA